MYGFDSTIPPPPYIEHMKLFTPESWDKLSTSIKNIRVSNICQAIATIMNFDQGYIDKMRVSGLVRDHHEKWDGSGYPNGLKGAAIPLEARIIAVADVFDALISRRPYKEPFPLEKSFAIIREG